MNATDVLLFVLLGAMGGLLAMTGMLVRHVHRDRGQERPGVVPVPQAPQPAALPAVLPLGAPSAVQPPSAPTVAEVPQPDLVVRPGAKDNKQLEVYIDEIDSPLVSLRPAEGRTRMAVSADPVVRDAVLDLLAKSPELLRQLRERRGAVTEYAVTFPKHAQQALAGGTARLMTSKSRILPTVVDQASGKIIAHGSIVTGTGASGVASGGAAVAGGAAAVPLLPVIAVAVVAVGAVYLMTTKLERAIAQVEQRVLALLDRMQDDDYGRLEAALHVASGVEALMRANQGVPDHDRIRLAIAARDADAIYLSRHRLFERFQEEYERIYGRHQQRGGNPEQLPKEFEKLLSDPQHFGKETAIYVAALVTRARTEATVAGLLAMEGHGDLALRRLQTIAAELDDDARDFQRRMHVLSGAQARGNRREIVGMAKTVTEMLDSAVQRLPPRELVDVTVRVDLAEILKGDAA